MNDFNKTERNTIYWSLVNSVFDLCRKNEFTDKHKKHYERILKKLWQGDTNEIKIR